jgi:2,4-diketo-3-deoxy-L-fuconate hydrolase
MKLIRFGKPGKERPGVCISNVNYDVSDYTRDYNEAFFENDGLKKLAKIIKKEKLKKIADDKRIGCPVARPSKIICIGLNYADHAKETGATPPPEPVIFLKATTAITGPYDDVIIPRDSIKSDWEVELGIVIGKKTSYLEEKDALDHIAGYCLHNDISEREFQMERSGTWDKGKGCDTFAPLGPWMVTKDEITDVNHLNLWLKVNDKLLQNGTTSNLIFNVPFLVSYVSRFMTMLPGDIISTGTPAGVGHGFKPPVYLKAGDTMELGIDGLGISKQKCVAYAG